MVSQNPEDYEVIEAPEFYHNPIHTAIKDNKVLQKFYVVREKKTGLIHIYDAITGTISKDEKMDYDLHLFCWALQKNYWNVFEGNFVHSKIYVPKGQQSSTEQYIVINTKELTDLIESFTKKT